MHTACPLLWNHIYISTTSQVRPCCRSKNEHITDDWNQSVFNEGIESSAHKTARQQMREGDWPACCTVCKNSENKFGHSARHLFLRDFDGLDFSKEPTNQDITQIDVKFNNTCNLACVMCNTDSSSQIYDFVKNYPQFAPASMGPSIVTNWMEEEKLQWCKKVIVQGNLQTLKTTGGEPFAQKHFWQLIDWCLENNYTNFEVKITTNGTKFNKPYLEKLSKFKQVQLCISCDGTEGVYEYIRHKSSWKNFTKNMALLQKYVEDHADVFITPNLHCVLQAYNCHNVIDLYNFANSYKFNFTIDCFINPTNSLFALDAVPRRIRKKLVRKIKSTEDLELKKYVHMMQNYRHDKSKTKKLYDQTIKFDKARKTNYSMLNLPFELT